MPNRPPFPRQRPAGRCIGLVGTYPPKLCGLATFAGALVRALRDDGDHVDVVRIDDGDGENKASTTTVADLCNGSPSSLKLAAEVLSRNDVAVIQHEYGIYGGDDGDEVLTLMRALRVPSVVTLHTVPLEPTAHQRSVLETIVALADRVVVMSAAALDRLADGYTVDRDKIVTIPHGASLPQPALLNPNRIEVHPQLLTWGLLGPGKGIEHVIDALAMLSDLPERPRYTVAGVTHPKVLARMGGYYRESLLQRCVDVGVADLVTFDDTYRTVEELMRFVASSDVVILPYDSRDQVTSGVLVDAVAAGRPVISTAFPHAMELLHSGAGIIVPHADPVALADAIRTVVTHPRIAAQMSAESHRLAPALSWRAVAGQYQELCDDLVGSRDSVAI